MDYQKQQAEAIEAATEELVFLHGSIGKQNELQNIANKLQQKMINEIETNNRVTSTHNIAIKWLTVAIVVLGVLTIWANYSKTGRYAISTSQGGKVFVLDTKTNQLWQRTARKNLYFGTNKTPKGILTESKDEQKQ